jgi:hypothetical protein
VKRVTVMFSGVSTSGSSNLQIQIGSGSFVTTGYTSSAYTSNSNNLNATSGFLLLSTNAASYVMSGHASLTIANSSSNLWVQSSVLGQSITSSASGGLSYSGGNLALSGTLDRVRITTVNGTDTFDAGSINILYE